MADQGRGKSPKSIKRYYARLNAAKAAGLLPAELPPENQADNQTKTQQTVTEKRAVADTTATTTNEARDKLDQTREKTNDTRDGTDRARARTDNLTKRVANEIQKQQVAVEKRQTAKDEDKLSRRVAAEIQKQQTAVERHQGPDAVDKGRTDPMAARGAPAEDTAQRQLNATGARPDLVIDTAKVGEKQRDKLLTQIVTEVKRHQTMERRLEGQKVATAATNVQSPKQVTTNGISRPTANDASRVKVPEKSTKKSIKDTETKQNFVPKSPQPAAKAVDLQIDVRLSDSFKVTTGSQQDEDGELKTTNKQPDESQRRLATIKGQELPTIGKSIREVAEKSDKRVRESVGRTRVIEKSTKRAAETGTKIKRQTAGSSKRLPATDEIGKQPDIRLSNTFAVDMENDQNQDAAEEMGKETKAEGRLEKDVAGASMKPSQAAAPKDDKPPGSPKSPRITREVTYYSYKSTRSTRSSKSAKSAKSTRSPKSPKSAKSVKDAKDER